MPTRINQSTIETNEYGEDSNKKQSISIDMKRNSNRGEVPPSQPLESNRTVTTPTSSIPLPGGLKEGAMGGEEEKLFKYRHHQFTRGDVFIMLKTLAGKCQEIVKNNDVPFKEKNLTTEKIF